MAIRWKLYQGKKVLQCDYRGLKSELSLLQLEEVTRLLMRCDDKVLLISTFEGAEIDYMFVRRVHELGKAFVREKAIKVALVGIEHMEYVMREAYAILAGKHPSFFDSEEEALQWLVN
jgi:hypothetical protein